MLRLYRNVKRFFGEDNPADMRRNDSVIITSKRRRFDVIMTLLLRHVSVGKDPFTLHIHYQGTKPIPEPMLAYHPRCSLAFT